MITHGFWTLNKNIVSVVQTLVTFLGLSVYVHFHGTLKLRFLWPLITSKVSEYGDLSSKNLQLIDGICDLSWHQKYQNEKNVFKKPITNAICTKVWKNELFWLCPSLFILKVWIILILPWLITRLIDYLLDWLLAW